MTDSELISCVKQYHKTVFRLAYSYVKNHADAEDICQDTFVKLMDYTGEFPAEEDCKRWLIRVVVNLSKNLLRSCRFTRTEELSDEIPLETADNEEKELWALVKALPVKYGEVIHLFYYEGYSVKEIADILSISQTAVTTRLSRGRNRLKALIKGTDEGSPQKGLKSCSSRGTDKSSPQKGLKSCSSRGTDKSSPQKGLKSCSSRGTDKSSPQRELKNCSSREG